MTIRDHAELLTGRRWEDMSKDERIEWLHWGVEVVFGYEATPPSLKRSEAA